METGKSSSGWVGAAALGLGLLMACLEGGADPEWSGIIRDDCGPTDGAAIAIRVEEGASAGCPGTLEPDTVPALYRLSFDGFPVDSLKPGGEYLDSGYLCPQPCPTMTHWSLAVDAIDKDEVRGHLRITTTTAGLPGKSRRERSGKVILRRCSRVHPFCG